MATVPPPPRCQTSSTLHFPRYWSRLERWSHTVLEFAAMLVGSGPLLRKRQADDDADELECARDARGGAPVASARRCPDDAVVGKPPQRRCVALRGHPSTPAGSPERPDSADELAAGPSAQREPDDDEPPVCWICLDGEDSGALRNACACAGRLVHPRCLAKWQLHKAGTTEEHSCRFCSKQLPDWREEITTVVAPDCAPVMTVSAGGKPITLRPSGGPGGLARFQAELLAALGLQQGTEIQLVFECIEPFTGSRMVLKGADTYDAAMHCAAIAAAKRRAEAANASSFEA